MGPAMMSLYQAILFSPNFSSPHDRAGGGQGLNKEKKKKKKARNPHYRIFCIMVIKESSTARTLGVPLIISTHVDEITRIDLVPPGK